MSEKDKIIIDHEAGTMVAEAIDAGRRIAEAEQDVNVVRGGEDELDGVPFYVTQGRAIPLPKECCPARKEFCVVFSAISDFVAFVGSYKDDRTQVFLGDNKIEAIFDFPRPDKDDKKPQRGVQRAQLWLNPDEMTAAWLDNIGKPIPQSVFAEFIEDQAVNISSPSASEMLEIARTLEGATSVEFASGFRLSNGDRTLKWVSTTVAKAGEKGDLQIPAKITVLMALQKGDTRQPVDLGLRYRVKDGAVFFVLTCPGFDLVKQAQRENLAMRVTSATGLPVHRVSAIAVG